MLLPLYRRDGAVTAFSAIDEPDYRRALAFAARWSQLNGSHRYATCRHVLLHRLITDAPPCLEVDHIDGDPLNNRQFNLRLVTHAQNHQNKPSTPGSLSRYRGVTFDRKRGKWIAKHKMNHVTYNLGRFLSEYEAGIAAARFRAEHMPYSNERR